MDLNLFKLHFKNLFLGVDKSQLKCVRPGSEHLLCRSLELFGSEHLLIYLHNMVDKHKHRPFLTGSISEVLFFYFSLFSGGHFMFPIIIGFPLSKHFNSFCFGFLVFLVLALSVLL